MLRERRYFRRNFWKHSYQTSEGKNSVFYNFPTFQNISTICEHSIMSWAAKTLFGKKVCCTWCSKRENWCNSEIVVLGSISVWTWSWPMIKACPKELVHCFMYIMRIMASIWRLPSWQIKRKSLLCLTILSASKSDHWDSKSGLVSLDKGLKVVGGASGTRKVSQKSVVSSSSSISRRLS